VEVSQRERWCLREAGGLVCERKSEYEESESDINGKRQEMLVGNRWNEGR
jgi:hypothetical protein